MAEIDADELVPGGPYRKAFAEASEPPELVRTERVAEDGDTFELEGERFEVKSVEEQPIEDAVPEDAREDYEADGDTVFVYETRKL